MAHDIHTPNEGISQTELLSLLEIVKRASEDKARQASSITAMKTAREQIKKRGQFIPKAVKQTELPLISF